MFAHEKVPHMGDLPGCLPRHISREKLSEHLYTQFLLENLSLVPGLNGQQAWTCNMAALKQHIIKKASVKKRNKGLI